MSGVLSVNADGNIAQVAINDAAGEELALEGIDLPLCQSNKAGGHIIVGGAGVKEPHFLAILSGHAGEAVAVQIQDEVGRNICALHIVKELDKIVVADLRGPYAQLLSVVDELHIRRSEVGDFQHTFLHGQI